MGGHDEYMVCGPIVGTPISTNHFERRFETYIVSLVEHVLWIENILSFQKFQIWKLHRKFIGGHIEESQSSHE